ncbi:low affinity immunoglobulin gamma Fc region receptor II [Fundulus heteroclitus]|uniref:low affinity immunoglobulin gamma Fc region receptor II n=1 Tax=Fundulus heteroclitus TaxID=8078 RepID=UPI0006447F47|nr:low affinity immunoglobulin gamma Fc region receptor II [Fundulus heteroclitus]
MAFASICLAVAATLSIQPDRRQFFRYEAFNLSCAVSGNFSGWTVMRNASEEFSPCENWGRPNRSSCINRSVYKSDNGRYWCQSEQGECSNTLDIRIHTGVVILESPALPVMEGDNVMLRCSYKERYDPNASSDFPAVFYQNDTFFGKRSEGKMILQKVSMSSKGFYKCQHPTKGESLPSWLEVKEKPKPISNNPLPLMTTSSLVCTIVLFIIYTIIFILCAMIYRRWARARAEAKRRDSGLLKPYN